MEATVLEAPLSIQVAIGAGYLGYLAAYTGIRSHHKQIDTAFITLSFGLFAATFFNLIDDRVGQTLAIIAASVLAVVLGVLWRLFGKRIATAALRRGRISYSDDDPSVFAAIFADTKHNVSQVLVTLEDGREYLCQDTGRFRDAAIQPFILGGDGSVAMYVTHTYKRGPDGKQVEREEVGVRDDDWGDNLTIIPPNRIQHIDLRFQKKLSRPSLAAAEKKVQPEQKGCSLSQVSVPAGAEQTTSEKSQA